MEIAKEILNQLRVLGGYKVMSWGAHNWTGTKDALLFKVNGHHFKGVVKITLNSMDLYDIEFFKGNTTEVVKKFEGIYFDDMVDVIDKYVEYIPEYGNM